MLGLWHRVWLFRVLVCAVVPRDNRVPVSAVSWSCCRECRVHGAWATALSRLQGPHGDTGERAAAGFMA